MIYLFVRFIVFCIGSGNVYVCSVLKMTVMVVVGYVAGINIKMDLLK
jgi:hypothetical protein